MVEQEVRLLIKDDSGMLLGILFIKAQDKSLNETCIFDANDIRLTNVPKVEEPDDTTPIQYYNRINSGNLSNLMLLEETKYDVMFETMLILDSLDRIKIFPSIQKENTLKYQVFEQSPYDMISDSGSRFIGNLNFHSYVGKSFLDLEINGIHSKAIPLEVRSKKIKYYEQYPQMIGELAEIASGLVYETNSPLYQNQTFDSKKKKTLYEDFMFLEYLFRPENLPFAYEYISRNFYSLLVSYVEDVPTTFASKIGSSEITDIISRPEHLYHPDEPPEDWPETMEGYVPNIISQFSSQDSIDTPENRLLKYFLESLDKVINDLLESINGKDGYIKEQLLVYQKLVQDYLSDRWTSEVGRLEYIPLNSQVLQKKEGYRDIFKYFLNFELAFRLEWQEIEDQIKGFERKLSELYEYWCFFKLIKVLNKLSKEKISYQDIYELNEDKWSIKVKRGQKSVKKFKINLNETELKLKLMFNRIFTNKTTYKSYSLPFRPDYTLLIEIDSNSYFVHFDAKYRSEGDVLTFYEKIGYEELKHNTEHLVDEVEKRDSEEENKRTYKYGDLYKMHTYKDAILKTEGAYILYPGDNQKIFEVKENEPIPSVGAFPLTPGKNGKEEDELSTFIIAILKNLIKRIISEDLR
jgi:hypothetical protein